jgi:DinB superfamily
MEILTVTAANPASSRGLDVPGADLISIQQQRTIAHQLRQATSDVEALVPSLDKADLLMRLNADSWCVAECLDHLTQTTCTFLPAMARAISRAPILTKNRTLRTGILPSVFIRILHPPYRIRLKVLPQLAPQNVNAEQAWSRFVDSQSELLTMLSSTAGLAIDRVRVKSPVYARITYNVYGAFRMLAAHQNRHVWQIGQILKTLDSRRPPALQKHSA